MTHADVVAEARRWLGTPYQHQGRVRGAGVDCAGLVIGVARALGIVAPDFDIQGYARQPDGHSLAEHCAACMAPIAPADALPGDVASIAFQGHEMHLAILADYAHGGLSIIHALLRARRVVEHRLDAAWHARIVGWYRMPGVA